MTGQKREWAKWIVQHKPDMGDLACGRCYPGGELVDGGYFCPYHQAVDYLGGKSVVKESLTTGATVKNCLTVGRERDQGRREIGG